MRHIRDYRTADFPDATCGVSVESDCTPTMRVAHTQRGTVSLLVMRSKVGGPLKKASLVMYNIGWLLP